MLLRLRLRHHSGAWDESDSEASSSGSGDEGTGETTASSPASAAPPKAAVAATKAPKQRPVIVDTAAVAAAAAVAKLTADFPAAAAAAAAASPAAAAKVPEGEKAPPAEPVEAEALDLAPFGSAAELAALGLDRLKAALLAAGLKCGGTLGDRADRLFSVKGLDQNEFPKELRAKPRKKKR